MPLDDEVCFRKPPWNRPGIWTGANLLALIRILAQNRFRVHWSCLPECMADLIFSTANTSLGILQILARGDQIKRIELNDDPLILIGHWRTGTTLLHELLALDPEHICPTTFQCFLPSHFLLTERFLKRLLGFALPPTRQFDGMRMGWDRPQEDEFALCNLGIPSPYATIAFPNRSPQNQDYLELDSLSQRERELWKTGLRRFLQQVQYNKPGRIVLKSPTHTFRLPILLEMFPNARFLHMVRHPLDVFTSTMRLWKSLYVMHGYQKPNFAGLAEHVLTSFNWMHERLEATRALVPRDRFMDLRFEEMVRDPTGTLKHVYSSFQLGDFDKVRSDIENYVDKHADYQPHHYAPASELAEEIYHRWQPYYKKYGYKIRKESCTKS